MKYNTLIFDLDGTLLNTIDDLADSLNYALNKNGLKMYSVEDVKFFVGSGVKVMVERALKDNMEFFDSVFNDFMAHYKTNSSNKTGLYDGVKETIKQLSLQGVKMAIVSNKFQKGVEDICKPVLGEYISVMIGEQEGYDKKPSPDMVNLAMKMLGVNHSNTAYVGDSDIDVLTAKNSKLDFIGCAYGFRGREFLEQQSDGIIIDKFEEILEIIK